MRPDLMQGAGAPAAAALQDTPDAAAAASAPPASPAAEDAPSDALGSAVPAPSTTAPLTPPEALPPRRVLRAADVIAVQRYARDSQALGAAVAAAEVDADVLSARLHRQRRHIPGGAGPARDHANKASGKPAGISQDDTGEADREGDNVVGGEDRVRYLAMVAATTVPPLRMGQAERERAVAAARPRNRIECMRRCGSDGFCDPSSAGGCGGEYCLAGRDLV